jgi:chorismate mutase
LHYPWSQAVRDADLAMLAAERRQLMMPIGEWKCLTGVVPAPIAVECWEPWHAKEKFLSRLRALAYRRGLHIPLLVRNI